MRGTFTTRLLIALGVLVCMFLGYYATAVLIPGLGDTDPGDETRGAFETLEDELFAELERGATLSRMPGLDSDEQGTGMLKGTVHLHCQGPDKPLPGVSLRLIGHDGKRPLRKPVVVTDEDGVFLFEDVPAHMGYMLLVDHVPYRRLTLRGNTVYADRTTDVGTILLGAPTSLKGEVLDSKGRPIVGAKVRVMRDGGPDRAFDARRAIFEMRSEMNYLAETAVGGDGRFEVEDISPGRYVLRVTAPGYATTFKSGVLVTVDEHSSSVRVILDAGVGFEGRILDETGGGIGDARVIAIAVPSIAKLKRFDRLEVRSAADGAYRLDTLIGGVSYVIEAWAEGYAPNAQLLPTGSGVAKRDLTLRPSGRIEGRVVDEQTGEGIPNAEVTAVVGPLLGFSPVSATTDASGGFVLAHVNAGPVITFSAKAAGYQPRDLVDFSAVKGLAVVAGETTWVDWSLVPGGMVRGRVTAEGRGVPYAELALVDEKRSRQRWTGEITGMTDADGRYELVGVQPGDYHLRVDAAGHAAPSAPDQTKVTMTAALPTVTKDMVLTRGATLKGVVEGPEGEVVRGARIQVEAVESRRKEERLRGESVRDVSAVSGGSGTFTIPGIPSGVEIIVTAHHDAWVRSAGTRLTFTPGQVHTLTLKLRAGLELPGRVQDPRGAGIAEARVRWGHVDGVGERELRDSIQADAFLGSRVLRTDGDGNFVIPGIPPGTLLVKVEKEGYSAWYRRDVMIIAEGPQPALTATLTPSQQISGRVRAGDSGRSLAGAYVIAQERGPAEGAEKDPGRVPALVHAETGPTGIYVLEHVPPGTHEIVVWFGPAGYVGAMQDPKNEKVRKKGVAAGANNVDFSLDPIPAPGKDGGDGTEGSR